MANTVPVGAGTVINEEKHKINVINKEKTYLPLQSGLCGDNLLDIIQYH